MALAWQPIDTREDPDAVRFEGDPQALVDAYAAIVELVTEGRPAWHRQAACRGQGCERWFPTRGQDVRPAQAVCAGCPVQVECLHAGMGESHGIWASTSERSRKRLRRSDGQEAA